MSGAVVLVRRWAVDSFCQSFDGSHTMPLRLGIDIACRAAHPVRLADEQGRFIWTGRRFRTTPQDLDRLWNMLPDGTDWTSPGIVEASAIRSSDAREAQQVRPGVP